MSVAILLVGLEVLLWLVTFPRFGVVFEDALMKFVETFCSLASMAALPEPPNTLGLSERALWRT